MKKAKILEEMKAALERYKTIKPEEFDFGDFVAKYDYQEQCGTICCLWGWEPSFGVLEGVKWYKSKFSSCVRTTTSPDDYWDWGYITRYLYYPTFLWGLTEDIPIRAAFNTGLLLPVDSSASLAEVLMMWEMVIAKLESGDTLDHLLNLD